MKTELEFSIMGTQAEGIRPLLEQFEAEYQMHVRLRVLAWDTAWSTLVRAAIYNDGPDVSEIGTTWVGDLIGMNALRPFDAAEVTALGRSSAFFATAWKSATLYGDVRVWAIPWLVGARLLFYRPRLLERAGLQAAQAFGSPQQMENTIQRLAASGIAIPWTVPTGFTHTTLLNLASWVWAAGGDFLNATHDAVTFSAPETLNGLSAYFRLGRYLAAPVRGLNGLEPDERFLNDENVGLTLSGPWLFCQARQRLAEGATDEIGVALPPGAPFVGGSNLAIWKSARNVEGALLLVRFLTQMRAQSVYSQRIGLLPARVEALNGAPFNTDPLWKIAAGGLYSGRSFPTTRLWGLLEDRLASAFQAVWNEVLADSELDPQQPLQRHLHPLVNRMNVLLRNE